MTATVCIFVKQPEPGRVKTRLEPCLGPEGAARLARAMFVDTVTTLRATGLPLVAAVSGKLDTSLGALVDEVWDQGDGDLGARQERVLQRALGSSDVAIAVGTDCLQLQSDWVVKAAELQSGQAVIGPSADGGYYLIALASCPDGLFKGISWSTSQTRCHLENNLQGCGLQSVALPEAQDIDEPQDLRAFVNSTTQGAESRAVLRELKWI